MSRLLFLVPVALLAAGVIALVMRYRRSRGILRLQMRWLVASMAAIVAALLFGLGSIVIDDGALGGFAWIPAILAYPTPPIAIYIAVTRHGLYAIDRIISRTIAYAAVTAILAVAFVATNLALQAVLADATGELDVHDGRRHARRRGAVPADPAGGSRRPSTGGSTAPRWTPSGRSTTSVPSCATRWTCRCCSGASRRPSTRPSCRAPPACGSARARRPTGDRPSVHAGGHGRGLSMGGHGRGLSSAHGCSEPSTGASTGRGSTRSVRSTHSASSFVTRSSLRRSRSGSWPRSRRR